MSKKLPFVKSDIPRDLRMFLDRVRELVSGSGADRLISLDDLTSAGLASSNSGVLIGPAQPFVATSPAPTNVSATAAIRTIFIEWDAPAYSGHAYAEVWGASTNSLTAAVLLGMSPGGIYVDETGPGTTRFYWVRFVNTNDSKGPYNATNGVSATTGPEVSYLLDTLAGAITESQLFSSLGDRINLIDAAPSIAGSVNARVNAEASIRAQAILDEAAARSTEDNALQTQINLLSAAGSGDFAELLAAVQEEQVARIAGDAAEASSRETLATQLRGNYSGTNPSALTSGIIYNERVTRVNAEGAISSSVSALSSTVTNNYNTLNSAITSEAMTRANADSALSSQITTLTSSVNGNTTAIQTEASTRATQTGDLFAKYTVKIDTNGYVSGFGLASTANNATPFSEFIIRADRFSVASPSGPGITPIVPFVVTTTPQTINGVSVPVGVYMNAAFIQNGTITNAKIGSLAVDDAKIASLSVGKLTAGSLSADQYIQSSNYVANTQGFRFDANGNAYLQNAVVRGTVYATDGTFAGSLSAATGTFSGALSAATGTFSGNLSAAGGTFNGTLDVKSAASGARMEIKNNVIKVFDASGALRVQIGDLTA